MDARRFAIRFSMAAGGLAVAALAVIGLVATVQWGRAQVARHAEAAACRPAPAIPVSKRPGPACPANPYAFILAATNAQAMAGMDDVLNERWCDIAGNYYSEAFIADFSYEGRGKRRPVVLVAVAPSAATLRGRLEAHRLKPNFAYQVKLRGVFSDRQAFEAIGHAGRWRLPGRGTNYTDADYDAYPDKAAVEAYILFDYFVTDRNGNAVRDFALDSSLHVLWNASRQGGDPQPGDLLRCEVRADDPASYGRPKPTGSVEWLWAEREMVRYSAADDVIRLPPGDYTAELVLTEESFHSHDTDGGFWATVCRCPVRFTVTP